MPKNIVICLDGTSNKPRGGVDTNVLRLYGLLDLSDPAVQVGYYDPGVGTFAAPGAWTPIARTLSRWAGLMFGAGLRQNLAEAYSYLMSVYEPGDRIYLFGFSRGAYNARALSGMLEVMGILRPGAENLVAYSVSEYARQTKKSGGDAGDDGKDWAVLRQYAKTFGASLEGTSRKDHAPVHFMGIWDTVKAAGTIGRELRWPYTRQMPRVRTVRHAISIDEKRRPYKSYGVRRPSRNQLIPSHQDLLEVWFAGVHSDVGGMYKDGAKLSDIPLKWMVEHAIEAGVKVKSRSYGKLPAPADAEATGRIHGVAKWWAILGWRTRKVPDDANIHASVRLRVGADPAYGKRLPAQHTFVDDNWVTHHPLKTLTARAAAPAPAEEERPTADEPQDTVPF